MILSDLQCDPTVYQIRADGLKCELVKGKKMQEDSVPVLRQCCSRNAPLWAQNLFPAQLCEA